MLLVSSLRQLLRLWHRPSQRRRGLHHRGTEVFRPSLQCLEDRLAPALVNWTNPLGGNWGVVSNWDAMRVPDAADDVVITQAGITIRHTFGTNAVRSLTSQSVVDVSLGSLTLGTGASQINSTLAIGSNGRLILGGATLGGSGSLANRGLLVAQGSSTINTSLTNVAGATLRVQGGPSSQAAFTVSNAFTNEGAIELTSTNGGFDATFNLDNGTLTNAPGATIRSLPGTGGSRFLNAQLANQGMMAVRYPLSVNNSGRTFNSADGALSVDLAGVLTIINGTTVLGENTRFAGDGQIVLAGIATLTLSSELTLPNGGANLAFPGTVTIGGPGRLINQRTLELTGDTVNAALVNQGTLVVLGTTSLNGALSNEAGATLRVQGGPSSQTALTVANAFTNEGVIELTSTNSGFDATFNLANGTLTNAPGSAFRSLPGTGGSRFLNANIDNQGVMAVGYPLSVNNSGRTFNSAGGALSVDLAGVLTIINGTTVLGEGTQFAGTGQIVLAGIATLTLSSELTLPNGGADLAFPGNVTIQGPGRLINQRTLELTGDTVNAALINQGTLVVQGTSSINGALSNEAGATLRVQGGPSSQTALTVANAFTNEGVIELTSTNSGFDATFNLANGTLTNAPGSAFRSLPGTGGSRFLNANIDNQGVMAVGYPLSVNNSGRTFNSAGGALSVDLAGVLTIINGGTVLGEGTQFAGVGQIVLAGIVTLTLSSELTLPNGGANLAFPGTVTIQGPGRLINQRTLELTGDTVNAALVNQGTLVVQGSSSINGALSNEAGATLRVQGGPSSQTTLTVANPFTNAGIIELTSAGGGFDATLNVNSGSLTNAASATILSLPGTGGGRSLNAQLINEGSLEVAYPLSVARPSAAHVNRGVVAVIDGTLTVNQTGVTPTFANAGLLFVGSGTTLTIQGGTFTNLNAGTLTGGTYHIQGTFRFPNASIAVNAATIVLEGPGAQIVDQSGNNALANLNRITETGSLTVQYGRNITASGTFTNAGTLSVGEGSTFAASFANFAGTTLTGGTFLVTGTLRVSNALNIETNAATLVLEWPTARVLNQSNANALANFTSNVATGVFRLQGGSSLTTPAFTNAGALVVGVGSTFTASGTYTQTGGTTMLVGGTLTAGTLVDLQAGVLSGSGTIAAHVRNAALIDVGGSGVAGLLVMNGNYTQTTGGTLNLELGAFDSGEYDALQITGTATLDGTLNVTLLESFVAREGDSFGVLAFASATGRFATLNLPDLGEGMFLDPVYDEVSFTLVTTRS